MPLDPYANIPLDPYVEQLKRQRIAQRDAEQARIAREAEIQDFMTQQGSTLEAAQARFPEAGGPQTQITGMYHDSTMAPSAMDISETLQPRLPPEPAAPAIPSGSGGQALPAPTRLASAAEPELGGPPGASLRTSLPAFARPRAPEFADVQSGTYSSDPHASFHMERAEESPELNVNLGDGWQRAGEGGHLARPGNLAALDGQAWDPVDNRVEPIRAAAGGGTLSMMTAPENAGRVTFASDLEAAQQESALRSARGEPSPTDIFRAQVAQDARFGPDDQLKFAQNEATNKEIAGLMKYKDDLEAAVVNGRLRPEEAKDMFEQAREGAAFRVQALRGGSLAAWGPNKNDVFGDAGALPPPPG